MNWKLITKYFCLAMILIIAAYDILAISKGGKESSISWFIISDLKTDYPLINDAWWFTMGHLFWRMKTPKEVI